MADVITRFKLETTQYDSALRDASKALSNYSKQAELAGKDFGKYTQSQVETARALGNIATSATNTKDKVKELVSAYNEVAKAYNKLTEEQKQSDFGKAMASSLEQLQGRIKDAKAEMNSTGGILGQLKDKFTVNIDALKVFSVGLQGAQAALGVARDAFFKNEEQLDTWGRVVEASESLYSGFLDALNTGDISGYLTRIGEITKAAQDAYNALDALNTFNAFNQVNVEKTRTGMTESIADYRSGQGTKEQVKAAGEAYQKELRERQKLEKQAYLEAIKKVAAERGVNGQDLITALSGSYGSYESLKAIPMSGTRTKFTPGGMFGGSTAYEEAYPVNRQEKLGAALRKLNDTELQSLQALGAQAERTGNEIAQVDKQLTRVLNGRQPGAGGGGGRGGKNTPEYIPLEGSIDAQTKKVQELQKAWRAAADDDSRERIKKQIDDAQLSLDYMTGKAVVAGSNSRALGYTYGEMFDQRHLNDLNNIVIDLKTPLEALEGELKHLTQFRDSAMTGEQWRNRNQLVEAKQNEIDTYMGKGKAVDGLDLKKIGDKMQGLSGGLASLTGGLKQMGIEIPQEVDQVIGVIQGLSTIIQGVQSVIQIFSTSSQAANTIALTANTAALWAVAATNAIPFAGGGIIPHAADGYFVPGNNFSGDLTPIMANAGELVLNRAQQGNLASQLQGGGMGGWKLTTKLAGTDLLVSLERTLQKQGYGRLATWQ